MCSNIPIAALENEQQFKLHINWGYKIGKQTRNLFHNSTSDKRVLGKGREMTRTAEAATSSMRWITFARADLKITADTA
jgi:hypothetical protein